MTLAGVALLIDGRWRGLALWSGLFFVAMAVVTALFLPSRGAAWARNTFLEIDPQAKTGPSTEAAAWAGYLGRLIGRPVVED